MDPTRNLCQVRNSFIENNDKYQIKYYKEEQQNKLPMSPRTRRNNMRDETIINYSINKQEHILIPNEIANPFRAYPASSKIFSKSAMILANIDAVYNFTGQVKGYIEPQNTKDFDTVFLDIKIGYINYIQYRLPASRIFSPCINFEINTLKNTVLDKRNIFSKCTTQNIIDYVLKIVEGVDLVIASSDYKNNLKKALKLCKPGGSFICRINDKEDLLKEQYITACNFEKISLFKPLSEDLNSSHSYLIATNFLGNSSDWISMLDVNIKIPNIFIEYVENYYKDLYDFRKYLLTNSVSYNLYKCKAIWNIF